MNKDLEDLIHELEQLSEDDDTKVGVFKGNNINELKDILLKPFLEIKVSRFNGSSVEINKAFNFEIEDCIPKVIGHLLNLLPEEKRNDVLLEAISYCKSKEGKLYENN